MSTKEEAKYRKDVADELVAMAEIGAISKACLKRALSVVKTDPDITPNSAMSVAEAASLAVEVSR